MEERGNFFVIMHSVYGYRYFTDEIPVFFFFFIYKKNISTSNARNFTLFKVKFYLKNFGIKKFLFLKFHDP